MEKNKAARATVASSMSQSVGKRINQLSHDLSVWSEGRKQMEAEIVNQHRSVEMATAAVRATRKLVSDDNKYYETYWKPAIIQTSKMVDNVVDAERKNFGKAADEEKLVESDKGDLPTVKLDAIGISIIDENSESGDEREEDLLSERGGGSAGAGAVAEAGAGAEDVGDNEEKKDDCQPPIVQDDASQNSKIETKEIDQSGVEIGKTASIADKAKISKDTAARLEEIAIRKRLARQREDESVGGGSIATKMTKTQKAKLSAAKDVAGDFNFDSFISGRTNKDGHNSPIHRARLFEAGSTIKKELSVLKMLKSYQV